MDAQRFRQAKEIFGDALDLPAARRADFVARRCGDDKELLAEIRSLLASHEETENFIEKPAFDEFGKFIFDERAAEIGAYRIEREIGRGGMGAVYLAARTEGFHKQVAVKLIKRGLDTDDIVRRFEQERQILAALDHPHIARLIDGGATVDGLPFLVMDYVEGVSITEFCERHQTPVDGRLELFLQICQAVAYAHQNLIVHRDIKPSNILVTPDGTAKLLDFGVAKLLAADAVAATAAQTLHAMTPEYASPEQLNGERVTTATDTYSLGVVLYELLAGERPSISDFGFRISDFRRNPPSSGSRRSFSNPHSAFRIPQSKDLGKIVSMALREEPERRYSSVEQFADDVRRYLKGLPVAAQTDSFSYRAEKFVRRNKVPVAAGFGVLASLVGGIIATSRQSRRARRQRDKAEKVRDFLQKTLAAPDSRMAGKDVKFVAVLTTAAATIDDDFTAQPDIAAGLHTTVGLTYLSLGIFDSSEKHLKKALDLRLKILPRQSLEVAASLSNYGKLLQEKGDLNAAEPLLTEACQILERKPFNRTLAFADALRNLAFLRAFQSELAEALDLQSKELEIRRALQGENHTEVARTLDELGEKMRLTGRLSEAESLHRRSIQILRKIYGDAHHDIAQAMMRLAHAIYLKKPLEAENLCREAVTICQRLLGDDHADTAWATLCWRTC